MLTSRHAGAYAAAASTPQHVLDDFWPSHANRLHQKNVKNIKNNPKVCQAVLTILITRNLNFYLNFAFQVWSFLITSSAKYPTVLLNVFEIVQTIFRNILFFTNMNQTMHLHLSHLCLLWKVLETTSYLLSTQWLYSFQFSRRNRKSNFHFELFALTRNELRAFYLIV